MSKNRAFCILGFVTTILAVEVFVVSAASAQSQTVIYNSVPSAEELAHELFGVPIPAKQPKFRTRGLRPEGEVEANFPTEKADVQIHWSANEVSANAPLKKYAFNIQFQFDSTIILPESWTYLDVLGEVLNANSDEGQPLSIVGHTDASGSDEYNLRLSMARAAAVRDYLTSEWNVDAKSLVIDGRGESELLSSLDPYHGSNRRVEFWIVEQPPS